MPLYRVKGVYYVDLPTAQGRLRRSTGTADKKAAQEFHEKLQGAIWRQERLGEKPPVTWGEAVAKWLQVKPRGIQDRYRLAALDIPLSRAIPLSESEMTSLLSLGSGATANRLRSLILAIHRTSGVEPPQIEPKEVAQGRTRWLSAEEWQRLKKALAKESPLLLQCAEFALATGLRENNVLELEWSQVDMRRRMAWIHGDQAKSGLPIGVRLSEDAMAVLEARRGVSKPFVFANPDTGLPYVKASNKSWYAAVKAAKLEGFRWHDLRHTWASWHAMNGTRLEELQQMGGWKTHSMVMRYAHLSTNHLAVVAENAKPVSMRYNKPRKAKAD